MLILSLQLLVKATASAERQWHVCRRNVASNVDPIVGISTSYQRRVYVGNSLYQPDANPVVDSSAFSDLRCSCRSLQPFRRSRSARYWQREFERERESQPPSRHHLQLPLLNRLDPDQQLVVERRPAVEQLLVAWSWTTDSI